MENRESARLHIKDSYYFFFQFCLVLLMDMVPYSAVHSTDAQACSSLSWSIYLRSRCSDATWTDNPRASVRVIGSGRALCGSSSMTSDFDTGSGSTLHRAVSVSAVRYQINDVSLTYSSLRVCKLDSLLPAELWGEIINAYAAMYFIERPIHFFSESNYQNGFHRLLHGKITCQFFFQQVWRDIICLYFLTTSYKMES